MNNHAHAKAWPVLYRSQRSRLLLTGVSYGVCHLYRAVPFIHVASSEFYLFRHELFMLSYLYSIAN